MNVEQRSGGGTSRAPLDHALCWRELKGSFSTSLRTTLSIRASTPHVNMTGSPSSRQGTHRLEYLERDTRLSCGVCRHLEDVFFDGERGCGRQRVKSNGRNWRSDTVADNDGPDTVVDDEGADAVAALAS